MSVAFSWVRYRNNTTTVNGVTSFAILDDNCPFFHFGNLTVGVGVHSSRYVLGLKFMGCGAKNIKVWLDGYNDGSTDHVYADYWQTDGVNWYSQPRVKIIGNARSTDDYGIYALPIPDQTDLTTYFSSPGTWGALGTTESSGISLNDCTLLNPNGEVYSEVFGISLYTPQTFPDGVPLISGAPINVRNFRLMCSFDTTDGLS